MKLKLIKASTKYKHKICMLQTYIDTEKCVDTSLLEADKLSYAVLVNVLGGTTESLWHFVTVT